MSMKPVELYPLAHEVRFTEDDIVVSLVDGRTVSVPLVWFPSLAAATSQQRENCELLGMVRESIGLMLMKTSASRVCWRGVPPGRARSRSKTGWTVDQAAVNPNHVNVRADFVPRPVEAARDQKWMKVTGRVEQNRTPQLGWL